MYPVIRSIGRIKLLEDTTLVGKFNIKIPVLFLFEKLKKSQSLKLQGFCRLCDVLSCIPAALNERNDKCLAFKSNKKIINSSTK